jgi:hypothetical protein
LSYSVKNLTDEYLLLKQSFWSILIPGSLATAGSLFAGIAIPEIFDDYTNRTALLLAGLGILAVAIGLSILLIIRIQPVKIEIKKSEKLIVIEYHRRKIFKLTFHRISHFQTRTEAAAQNYIELVFTGGLRLSLIKFRHEKQAILKAQKFNQLIEADPENAKFLQNKINNLKYSHIDDSKFNDRPSESQFKIKYQLYSGLLTLLAITGFSLLVFVGFERMLSTVISIASGLSVFTVLSIITIVQMIQQTATYKVKFEDQSVRFIKRNRTVFSLNLQGLSTSGIIQEQSALPEIQFQTPADRDRYKNLLLQPASLKRSRMIRSYHKNLNTINLSGFSLVETLNLYHWIILKIRENQR